MLMRNVKVPPSLLLVVVFLVFLGVHFSQTQPPAQPRPPPPEKKAPRIALVTFVTEERSYLHLALKSKNRKLSRASPTWSADSPTSRLLSPTRP